MCRVLEGGSTVGVYSMRWGTIQGDGMRDYSQRGVERKASSTLDRIIQTDKEKERYLNNKGVGEYLWGRGGKGEGITSVDH